MEKLTLNIDLDIWCLDDGNIAGPPEDVFEVLKLILRENYKNTNQIIF